MIRLFRVFIAVFSLIIGSFVATNGFAQSLIRDSEIEEMLRDFTNPILRAAGLDSTSVDLYIVNDPSLNAFVTRGQNIFLHTGLIIEAESPNQLKGVIAHEAGHIAAGHLARRDQQNKSAYGAMLIAAGVGIAAMLAGEGGAGAMILGGSSQFGAIDALAHSRISEASADQAAAKYLDTSGQSADGLLKFFEKFRYQEVLSPARRYPYFLGHPLSSDRIEKLREIAAESPNYENRDPEEDQHALEMAHAKLIGFIDAPQTVFSKYPPQDTSTQARYARAVAYYRAADLKNAIKSIDSLIEEDPNNPYFYELKGQIYYESGKADLAVEPLRNAIRLKPDTPLFEIALAQALLVNENSSENINEAVELLKLALHEEPTNGMGWYQLSIAYDRLRQPALARYAIAEQAFAMGNYQRARSFAVQAQSGLVNNKPQWRRASDIIVISDTQLASSRNR